MAEFQTAPAGAGAGQKLLTWVDNRFPLSKLYKEHLSEYYAPKNFNIWYVFGGLATLVLVMQILTGIFLTMHYKPDAAKAFESVEYIMRDVPWGWLVRYMHSTGASAFFIVVYLHMFRGLIYGSYRKPRELVWLFGCGIFLCLMAEAFMGYLLPWGQMSYWGAQVIVNLFSAVPFIGPDLSLLIRGDYVVGDATLNRFFSFHVIAVPLVLLGLVAAHIIALHEVGSNNPDGVEIKSTKNDKTGMPLDGIPFHPYYTVHDIFFATVFLFIFSAVVFFAPEGGGYFLEFNNFIEANPLKTPAHIAPVWYFTPYYSMLRATTDLMVYVIMAHDRRRRGAGDPSRRLRLGDQDRYRRGGRRRGRPAQDLRRQVLGRRHHGRRGADPVLPALARPQPGALDPLPARLAQVPVCAVRGLLPGARLPRLAAAFDRRQLPLADRHADLLRLLPAHALVEPHRHLQARARARELLRPLTDRAAPR